MVSDMKEWCNQDSKPKCKLCDDIGAYKVFVADPLGGFMWEPCFCKRVEKPRVTKIELSDKRQDWDSLWMNLARGVASRSTCRVPDRKVGCVIVSGDNTKVLSIGYNGSAKGDDNSCEYSEDRKMVGDSRCTCLHSEMNSLVKLDTSNPCYKRMYLTLSPCSLCYKLIVNAGIDEVIYDIEYNAENIEKLRGLGVKVRKYEDN